MKAYLEMEMPKEGNWITLSVFPDGQCVLYSWCGNNFDFMEHLTVIPVPPHGLIDREKILDAIRLELAQANACNDMDDYEAWMRAFDFVRKFPTIIPAEPPKEE